MAWFVRECRTLGKLMGGMLVLVSGAFVVSGADEGFVCYCVGALLGFEVVSL